MNETIRDRIKAVFYWGLRSVAALGFLAASIANADLQSSSAQLKLCLDREVNAEIADVEQAKRSIYERCKKELQAFEADLPAGAANIIKDDLDQGISNQLALKKSGG